MRIVCLVENTSALPVCTSAHGLSLYIETPCHHLLMDTGPSDVLLANAKALGIDLSLVDTVIISHGHYDHADGLLSFRKVNKTAEIYMQKTADGQFYSCRKEYVQPKYIGICDELKNTDYINCIEGDFEIDDELFLMADIKGEIPGFSHAMKVMKNDVLCNDLFAHEQCLVIRSERKSILFTGCAHHGILNILNTYRERFSCDPDIVIGGFHLMQKSAYTQTEITMVKKLAGQLKQFNTQFFTCHCTGVEAFALMKEIMGVQLHSLGSGEEINIRRSL